MSRFKSFLLEGTGLTFDNIVKDCQPWLKYCHETQVRSGMHTIYRGMKGKNEFEIQKLPVRTDRVSKDTPYPVSQYIDLIFQKKFGWKPRSQAIFGIRDFPNEVAYYGTPYAIYPIGEFKIVFSSYVADFTYDLAETISSKYRIGINTDELKEFWLEADDKTKADILYAAKKLFIKGRYTERAPLQQAGPGTELMIGCKEYYAVPMPLIHQNFIEMKEKGLIGEL